MKKLKRLLRLRNSAGFTLAEVIISCALLGILILGIMNFVTPILKSVREKEQDARATMLAQTLNTYIGSTIQYAYFVCTVSDCAKSDTTGANPAVVGATYTAAKFAKTKSGKGLETLKTCFNTMNTAHPDTYEIRCIGLRWREDVQNKEKKLMLTNEVVNQTTLALDPTKSRLVFEECFYSGLYPTIDFVNYDNQYYVIQDDGTKIPQVKDEDIDIASGLELVTRVHLDADCYNTNLIKKVDAMFAVQNEGLVAFSNIRSNYINRGDYEIIPNLSMNYVTALSKDSAEVYTGDDGDKYYAPESFIYYIVRKTKTDAIITTP